MESNSKNTSPDIIYNSKLKNKNKNSSAFNLNENNNINFSLANNSQNNFNNIKKEINTPKNIHSNRMLIIDSSKDFKSK